MLQALVALALSFLVVAVATPAIRTYALQRKLGDKPNGRKIHSSMIPHLGGIGVVVGVWVSLLAVSAIFGGMRDGVLGILLKTFVPVGMIVILGLADDTRNLKAHQKLSIQTLASIIIAVSGFHLLVGIPFFDGHLLFVVMLTAFYLVGTSSSVNLIDGLDGLAAGVSFISAVALGIAAALLHAPALVCVSLALSGACLGFLLYNFPPGKIFMGDTGSLFLGIMLGVLACSITMIKPAISTFFGVCFVLAIPMLDSWLAIARRLALRRPVFEADHMHMHHVLTSFGLTARQTLAILYPMQAVMAGLGVLAIKGFVLPVVAGVAFLIVAFPTFYHMMVASKQKEPERAADFVPTSIPSLEK